MKEIHRCDACKSSPNLNGTRLLYEGMGRLFGFVGLMIVVGVGAYIYIGQVRTITPQGSSPTAAIAVTAVRNDLMAIANAERHFFASNGKYATLNELRANSAITSGRGDYNYSAEILDSNFTITAVYSGTDPHAPKRISVNDAMEIKTE